MSDDYKFDTLSLHAGHVPDDRYGSRAVPIHQTTSYVFKDTRHAAALYNMEVGGHLYSRISNPTVAVLEQRIAALEGAAACTATASGMAAPFLCINDAVFCWRSYCCLWPALRRKCEFA
jgi:O-acetylhomoserine (thiol)-lyase